MWIKVPQAVISVGEFDIFDIVQGLTGLSYRPPYRFRNSFVPHLNLAFTWNIDNTIINLSASFQYIIVVWSWDRVQHP